MGINYYICRMKSIKTIFRLNSVTIILIICTVFTINADERASEMLKFGREAYLEGNYNVSMQQLLRLEDYARRNQEKVPDSLMAECYLYLGNVSMAHRNYKGAIKYYEYGIARCKNESKKKRLYHNLASSTCLALDHEEVDKYMRMADEATDTAVPREAYSSMLRKAIYEKQFGDSLKAVSMMRQSLEYLKGHKLDERLAITPVSELSEAYEKAGREDSTLYYLREYERLANKYKAANMIVDATGGLMRHFTRVADLQNTLLYQQQFFKLRDSLLNGEAYMMMNFDKEQKEREDEEIKIHDLELRVKKITSIAATIGVAAAIVILLLILMLQHRRLNKAYHNLYKRNRELLDAEDTQKETQRLDDSLNSELLASITKFMDESDEWTDPNFSIATLASRVGRNTKYVSTFINDRYGCNFRAFINGYRIKEAIRRLENPEKYGRLTIRAIGESVGFQSVSTFTAAFQKETGLTPAVYMKYSAGQRNEADKATDKKRK